MDKDEILALAGEPVAWTDDDDVITADVKCLWQLNGNTLANQFDKPLYPVDTIHAVTKPLEQEIERVTAGWREAFNIGIQHQEDAKELRQQLAASQAREQQYRDAIESYLAANDPSEFVCVCDFSVGHLCGPCFAHKQQTPLRKSLAKPQDTSALQAIIAKAGEVMREWCAEKAFPRGILEDAIRALPGVTLEDLQK
jgi:hypothetical protein